MLQIYTGDQSQRGGWATKKLMVVVANGNGLLENILHLSGTTEGCCRRDSFFTGAMPGMGCWECVGVRESFLSSLVPVAWQSLSGLFSAVLWGEQTEIKATLVQTCRAVLGF